MDRGEEEGDRAVEEEQESSSAAAGLACGERTESAVSARPLARPAREPARSSAPARPAGTCEAPPGRVVAGASVCGPKWGTAELQSDRAPAPRSPSAAAPPRPPPTRAPSPRGRRAREGPCPPACRRTSGRSSNTWPCPTAYQLRGGRAGGSGDPAPGLCSPRLQEKVLFLSGWTCLAGLTSCAKPAFRAWRGRYLRRAGAVRGGVGAPDNNEKQQRKKPRGFPPPPARLSSLFATASPAAPL